MRSPFVAALLRHLDASGADWAPRYLGADQLGRDVLTFIPGHVPERWRYFPDEHVARAGHLPRRLHDATRRSALADGARVVCHNDFGPNNAVFSEDGPFAMIDFDMAEPGDPLEDVAYAAWAWCISSKQQRPSVDVQARQLRVLVEAYGDVLRPGALIDAILERQVRNERFWNDARKDSAAIATPCEKIAEIVEWSRTEAAFVTVNRSRFEDELR